MTRRRWDRGAARQPPPRRVRIGAIVIGAHILTIPCLFAIGTNRERSDHRRVHATHRRQAAVSFARDLDEMSFKTGHGGVFNTSVEDDLVCDKAAHGNETPLDIIVDAVDNHVSAEA